jgi:transposase
MTIDGATDAAVSRVYVEQVLRPALCPGDAVIIDDPRARKAAGTDEAIKQAGAPVLYLSPHSPDLPQIERCQSKLQAPLYTARARIWSMPSRRR